MSMTWIYRLTFCILHKEDIIRVTEINESDVKPTESIIQQAIIIFRTNSVTITTFSIHTTWIAAHSSDARTIKHVYKKKTHKGATSLTGLYYNRSVCCLMSIEILLWLTLQGGVYHNNDYLVFCIIYGNKGIFWWLTINAYARYMTQHIMFHLFRV